MNSNYASVGGGVSNTIGTAYSVISGGCSNTVQLNLDHRFSSYYATVGGGANNATQNTFATVSGGTFITASGIAAVVGGGGSYDTVYQDSGVHLPNVASGDWSVIGSGSSSGSGCTLVGTIGQVDAGLLMTGGGYSLAGGSRSMGSINIKCSCRS
ncbi:MAG TPA: hypothetical protein VMP08_11055 [Anaerolineae bacterium]|nr:hypothetical protein [Anaerolineae bacterium]